MGVEYFLNHKRFQRYKHSTLVWWEGLDNFNHFLNFLIEDGLELNNKPLLGDFFIILVYHLDSECFILEKVCIYSMIC